MVNCSTLDRFASAAASIEAVFLCAWADSRSVAVGQAWSFFGHVRSKHLIQAPLDSSGGASKRLPICSWLFIHSVCDQFCMALGRMKKALNRRREGFKGGNQG